VGPAQLSGNAVHQIDFADLLNTEKAAHVSGFFSASRQLQQSMSRLLNELGAKSPCNDLHIFVIPTKVGIQVNFLGVRLPDGVEQLQELRSETLVFRLFGVACIMRFAGTTHCSCSGRHAPRCSMLSPAMTNM
jgi:hypothetical protein